MTVLSRRTLLAALATPAPLPVGASLREAGHRVGLRMGSSSEVDLASDPAYADLITSNCDLFAPNLNWGTLAPSETALLAPAPGSLPLVRRAGLALTGYHLLWHERLPTWFAALDRAAAERAIVAHIRGMAAAYGRNTFSWNVINEAIKPDDPDGLRRGPLTEKFGSALFDLAYHTARESASGLLRVYNDYDLELATPDHERRRTALLHLLDTLQARAVPVQAIGLQSHLRSDDFEHFDPALFRRFLAELTGRGLTILITELDVLDLSTADVATRDRQIADIYRRYLAAALDETNTRALVFWGLSDRHSWLNDPNRRSLRRPDGMPGRPSLFDHDMSPKPALSAVMASLAAAPSRPLLPMRR